MDVLNDNDVTFIGRFLQAFKILGGNKQGLIDYDKIKLLFKKNGIGEDEVFDILDGEHTIKDNKLNFIDLCITILSTKRIFNHITLENGKITSNHKINSHTFTRKKGNLYDHNKDNKGETKFPSLKFTQKIKGAIFNIEPHEYLSNCYKLQLNENTNIEICAKALVSTGDFDPHVPIEILLFQSEGEKKKTLISISSTKNSEGYCTLKLNCKKGQYMIVPILLKWHLNNAAINEAEENMALTNLDNEGNLLLTPSCERALRLVYDCIDIDQNGLLNQTEFDIFIRHICGIATTDEWSTIEDNFEMENDQLTFQGFLDLYKMALETDPEDVISMFQRMGMNSYLQQENAQPFTLEVNSDKTLILEPLPISPYNTFIDKVLCKLAVEKGSSSKVKNMNDLFLYTHKLPHRISIIVQNQSHSKVAVRLDCTKSQNCESHRKALDFCVQIPPRSCMVGHHLFPVDVNKPWNVTCLESLK